MKCRVPQFDHLRSPFIDSILSNGTKNEGYTKVAQGYTKVTTHLHENYKSSRILEHITLEASRTVENLLELSAKSDSRSF